jgi:hypothetical protein
MKTIRIKFVQIWNDFLPHDNFVLWILKHKYDVIVDNVNYDYVLGAEEPGKISIFIAGAYGAKNIYTYNRVMSQYYIDDDPRFVRIPLYIHYVYNFMKEGTIQDMNHFFKERYNDNILSQKKEFCAFISSGQAGDQYRDSFVKKLQKYKKVHCAGTRHNNVNQIPWAGDNGMENSRIKRNYIKDFKFTFSFEAVENVDGYVGGTSEKLLEPMISNSLPLYWGNPRINEEFNPKSFINFYDYDNDEEMIERIIEVDKNDQLYLSYMNSPLSIKNDNLNMDFLISQMDKIIN